jgi:hypothetical protein
VVFVSLVFVALGFVALAFLFFLLGFGFGIFTKKKVWFPLVLAGFSCLFVALIVIIVMALLEWFGGGVNIELWES